MDESNQLGVGFKINFQKIKLCADACPFKILFSKNKRKTFDPFSLEVGFKISFLKHFLHLVKFRSCYEKKSSKKLLANYLVTRSIYIENTAIKHFLYQIS